MSDERMQDLWERKRSRAIKVVRGLLPRVGSDETTLKWAAEIVDAVIGNLTLLRACGARQPGAGYLCRLPEGHDAPHSWETP